jgi:hypothetical protein
MVVAVVTGYDPEVSGPWSDVDDYPPGEIERRHREAVPLAYTLGGDPTWRGSGRFGYWIAEWEGVPTFVRAFAYALLLMAVGAALGLLVSWASGGSLLP